MSKTSLLDLIVIVFPVADLPEMMIRLFLAGDLCLDDCDTIERVFTTIYRNDYDDTFLDKDCTFRHSFNDVPVIRNHQNSRLNIYQKRHVWYRNGKISRENDLPAFISRDCKLWLKNGKFYRQDSTKPVGVFMGNDLYFHDNPPRLQSLDKLVLWEDVHFWLLLDIPPCVPPAPTIFIDINSIKLIRIPENLLVSGRHE